MGYLIDSHLLLQYLNPTKTILECSNDGGGFINTYIIVDGPFNSDTEMEVASAASRTDLPEIGAVSVTLLDILVGGLRQEPRFHQ